MKARRTKKKMPPKEQDRPECAPLRVVLSKVFEVTDRSRAEESPLGNVTGGHIEDLERFSELPDLRQSWDAVFLHYSPAIERNREDEPCDRVGPYRAILAYCGVFSGAGL
jgi:hypothetical protein